MKKKQLLCHVAGCVLVWTFSAVGQSFQNLGFESATVPSLPAGQYGGFVSSTSALPNWTAYLGTIQTTQILQNNASVGSATIGILGPNLSASQSNVLFGGVIEGNYSAVLQAGFNQSSGTPVLVDASINQTGLVPASAKSIQVKVNSGGLFLNFAGQNLPFTALSSQNNYTLYGADISQFAGQVGLLTLSTSVALIQHSYDVELDSIVFSTQAIPEPTSVGLIGIGVLLSGFCRKRKISR